MARRTKAQQSILDERLDEIVAEIVNKKSQSSNLTTNNISKAEEESSSRIKTTEVIDWTPQKPSCPKHKSEMTFDKSESKWKCTDEECKVVARRRENSQEPNPAELPSGEVLLYWDKHHNKYYVRQSDRLISLPFGTAYQNYLPYEVPIVSDAIGFLQIPIKYPPIAINN